MSIVKCFARMYYIYMRNSELAQNIKFYRKNKKLSQFELAELAGINEKTVTRAESGKIYIKLQVLYKIAKALNIPIYRLFIPQVYEKNESAENLKAIINAKLSTLDKAKLVAIEKMISIIDEIK